ncbi:MAG: TRAP transporter substrate-binding protein [Pseudomonadota bacterium]
MNTIIKSALAAAVAATGVFAAIGASAQEVTLRCQHFVSPKAGVPSRFMQPWADKVMADSGGRIKVELYPGMQLGGKPPALYDQIKDGVIDCGWALPAYTPGRFPSTEAIEQPFVTTMSAEKSSMAAWEYTQKWGQQDFKDVHLMAVHVHGQGIIHKKGDPITKLEDFEGLKLRGPSRAANGMLEAMGATTVGMPVPAFPEALSKGVVDGGVIPAEIVIPLKVHELADSHTYIGGDAPFYNTFFIWAMNKDTYASLPDDLKAVIDANSGIATSAWAGRAMDEADAQMTGVMQSTDNKFHTLSDEERARWMAVAEPQVAAWAEGMENGAEMLADAKSLMAKHNE